jgi:hypothetical protein
MKTTIEISDSLLREARKLASQEHTTIRALVEEGLRRLIAERKYNVQFTLRKATFRGQGMHPDLAGGSWAQVRDRAYEGRGA